MDMATTKRNVTVLVAAQAILGAQMPMLFVVGGLAGGWLTGHPCFATLPISLIVLGSMITAPWLSSYMQRNGRKAGFFVGTTAGALGAAVSAYGLWTSSFTLFLIGSLITGVYMSAQGFYRFAAADGATDDFRPKAISYVMAGGLLSAILGPQLNKIVQDFSVIPFLGTYITVIALNLGGMTLFTFLRLPALDANKTTSTTPIRTRMELLKTPVIAVAIVCAMISYALMNLVMTATPIAVVGCGFTTNNANDIVMAHVLAMFAPSFFTGHLIARFGVYKIISIGILMLAIAGVFALTGITLFNFYGALIFLGLGWNFGFIGSTTLLSASHKPEERGRVQGMNDAIVFGCVTLASLSSGGLLNCAGADVVSGWQAVNYAMVPFLLIAAAALIWVNLRPKAA